MEGEWDVLLVLISVLSFSYFTVFELACEFSMEAKFIKKILSQ